MTLSSHFDALECFFGEGDRECGAIRKEAHVNATTKVNKLQALAFIPKDSVIVPQFTSNVWPKNKTSYNMDASFQLVLQSTILTDSEGGSCQA